MSHLKLRRYAGPVVLWAAHRYCRSIGSYPSFEQMMARRGVSVDHSVIYRGAQRYAGEMEKRLSWQWCRPRSFLVPALLVLVSVAGRADTIVQTFSANGIAVKNISNLYGVTSTSFARFDPSLGTLTSVQISLNGTAVIKGGLVAWFEGITPGSDPGLAAFGGSGNNFNDQPFAFYSTGMSNYLQPFSGQGSQTLILDFFLGNGGTVTTSATSGTLTYDYAPAAITTPEPSSLALLSTGLLSIAGVLRKRLGK